MIDIKALRAAAEVAETYHFNERRQADFRRLASPTAVIALCDEIERRREQVGAYQLHEKQLLAAKMRLGLCSGDTCKAYPACGLTR